MDYEKIGERIRRARKAMGLSQEELAEKIGISVTHMSHIETGSTKLSLQVLVDTAASLGVSTDSLLFGQGVLTAHGAAEEISRLLENCSQKQTAMILDILKSVRMAMEQYAEE